MTTKDILGKLEKDDKTLVVSLINGNKKPQNLFATQIAHDIIPIFYDLCENPFSSWV